MIANNQTVELLRKLLDDNCIVYKESHDHFCTRFHINYCESCGDYIYEIAVMGACVILSKCYLTPEQAIAIIKR